MVWLTSLVAEQATSTDHFGEVMVVVDGQADQRVATPHLWEGALFYLTVLALEEPEALWRWEEVLPASVLYDEEAAGCCSGRGSAALVLLPLSWWRRRRDQGTSPPA